ncbi:MAG TPA: hypothetical protein VGN57_05680 [Pirellulaceae bacterium]|nr:hypothetical protein [Pirellulaceae bacterium]
MARARCAGIVGGAFLLAGGIGFAVSVAADDTPKSEIKYSLEDVMKQGMKGGLVAKVAAGQASKEEKATLLLMVQDMARQEPHKGDAASWKALNAELVAAAEDAVAGKPTAGSRLKQAANCKGCHDLHK